ncbi:MAG TPA: lytic transglycosylase domain-containing protein, partial [Thermomicrobiales bacterium]|nr:lytic transglycosylase domain-containing protein [Thermomicrobiales bacterium]
MSILRRPVFRVVALLTVGLLLSTSSVAATVPIRDAGVVSDASTPVPTATATSSPVPQAMTAQLLDPTPEPAAGTTARPKPSPRPFSNPAGQPAPTATPTPSATPPTPSPTATAPAGPPRLNDDVLRWLPEIIIAADATGVPPELIAAIMRVESQGNPNIISPAGARGLMQIMPDELSAQGIPFDAWHDPATNIMAGAVILLQRSGSGWDGAAASYFG